MGVASTAAMNAFLTAALLRDTSLIPDTYVARLWIGNPEINPDTAYEPTGGGYAAVTVASDTWLAATDGSGTYDGSVGFAAPTGEWDDECTHWSLNHPITDDLWLVGPLKPTLDVADAAVTGPAFVPTVYFADRATPAA